MNVCIIGDGLAALSLAKNLVNKKINVHIYYKKKNKNFNPNRTIGISRNNLQYFNEEIQDIPKKNIWKIKNIEIYSEKTPYNKIINFENNNKNLFSIVKNDNIYRLLSNQLSKNKFYKKKIIKDNFFYQKLLRKNEYDLVINCDSRNLIAKKYFIKTINKDYNNLAYTTIFNHQKLLNNTAIQIFTKYGPIAFLPTSDTETSVVYSIDTKNYRFKEKEIIELIKKYNPKFVIKKISKLNKFKLKLSNSRIYYYKNIAAFGDCLHKIHPLAGQGFNMTIRDIKVISKIIQDRIDLGMNLDASILHKFEKKTKHVNFIFSNGIDIIYEIFNFDKSIKNKNLNNFLKYLGKNKILNKFFVKYADKGFHI
tara:strand:+ start:2770 stop:3867 length:1098 start_codon:yes stop_codon:yes gene_type:complete